MGRRERSVAKVRARRAGMRSFVTEGLEPRRLMAGDLVISEFLASNDHSIFDAFGSREDWIEIHNRSAAAVNLGDYFLTDSAGNPEQWRFPNQSLAAGAYLVVFASGRDLAVAGQQLHTNFKLSAGGEYLGLIRASDGGVEFEYAPTFPPQSTDISYGLFDANDPGSARTFFSSPTPGAVNAPSVAAPVFSQPGKTFTGTLPVTLSTPTPGAEIRYTTNRSVPTASSPLYTGPINLTATTVIRAKAFAPGYVASPVASQSYVAVDSSVSAFGSNLPIVVLDTFGTALNDATLTPAAATFIDTAPADGRADMLDAPQFDGRIGLRIRGSTSSFEAYPKKQFAVELWDENNEDYKVPLLGMPAESDWVLYAPYSEKSLMQNALAMEWAQRQGHYASRTRFVEVYLNTDGGSTINYNSDYWGVYILMEKIKDGDDRVDVTKMSPVDNTGDAVTGGYLFKKDRVESTESSFTTAGGQTFVNVEPDETEITAQQKAYLTSYMNDFEAALFGANFADPVNGYAKYIDVQSWIDFWLVSEMTKSVDAFWLSTYFYKDRGGKVAMGPVWDFNLALGQANYRDGASAMGWNHDSLTSSQYFYFPRLFQDPNFALKVADRWQELRRGAWSTPALLADVDENVAVLSDGNGNYPVGQFPSQPSNNAVVRNFKRWNVLGQFTPGATYEDPQGRWIEDVAMMKSWIAARVAWMDGQFVPAPALSPAGGDFSGGASVAMTGKGQATAVDTVLLAPGAPARAFVPSGNITGWQNLGYTVPANWLSGTIGVGYDRNTSPVNYLPQVGLNVESQMFNVRTSVFIRVEFNVPDPSAVGSLVLRMKYDDGFFAWVNGVRVIEANAPENVNPVYNTAAVASRDDNAALQYVEFDISAVKPLLVAGTNVLAIQAMNNVVGSSDLLVVPQIVSRQYVSPTGGQVYYTTEGTDPRAGNGAVSPTAQLYTAAVNLAASTRIKARTLNGGVWSGLADEIYNFGPSKLRVTELMYNPASPPAGSPYTAQDFEFVEVKNTGSSPLSLKGYKFTTGITYDFPDVTLAAGAYAVIVKNLAAFQSRYDTTGVNVLAGVFTGSLDNGGETLAFQDGFGQTVQSFTYDDAWYPTTDGPGYSLVIRDPNGVLGAWDAAAGWRASYALQGLPSANDADTTPPALLAGQFDVATGKVTLTFAETVAAGGAGSLAVIETLSGATIAGATLGGSGTNVEVLLPSSLASGLYRITIPAPLLNDVAGNHPSADVVFTFLLVNAGQTLVLPPGGQVYTVDQLAIGVSAALDVSDDLLVVKKTGPTLATVQTLVAAGSANGRWNGRGIFSSPAATDPLHVTGVGYADDGNSIRVQRTHYGDANLDGQISADDVATMLLGQAQTRADWSAGNFNYDDRISSDDWALFAWGAANAPAAPAFAAEPMASVADELLRQN